MTRNDAYTILTKYMTNQNLLKHSFAAEAAMKEIYDYLYATSLDPVMRETWGITGLLHDADYEMAKGRPEVHGLLLFDLLGKDDLPTGRQVPEEIAHAIKAHNYEYTKVMPETPMDWGIACADQLTGLVVACALVHPDKKLASITPEFVVKRMKEKSFAKGADRKAIYLCEEKLGIPLNQFVAIVLRAMQKIAPTLGL